MQKDPREAVYWYRRAIEHGYEAAPEDLGDMYESGEGIRRNYEEAVYWYRRAAEQESAHAMKRLGDMYRRGA